MEQKVEVVREMPEMEAEYEFDSHTEDQFVMSKGNLWDPKWNLIFTEKVNFEETLRYSNISGLFIVKNIIWSSSPWCKNSLRLWNKHGSWVVGGSWLDYEPHQLW